MKAQQISEELKISRAQVYILKKEGKLLDFSPQAVYDYKLTLAGDYMAEVARLLGRRSPQFRLFLQQELEK